MARGSTSTPGSRMRPSSPWPPGRVRGTRAARPTRSRRSSRRCTFISSRSRRLDPPRGPSIRSAFERGKVLFEGKARCATCHVPPLYTEPGHNLHTPAEIGVDGFQADRSPTHAYRTAPLRGLWTHQKGGFYHDGRFATLRDVVEPLRRVLQTRPHGAREERPDPASARALAGRGRDGKSRPAVTPGRSGAGIFHLPATGSRRHASHERGCGPPSNQSTKRTSARAATPAPLPDLPLSVGHGHLPASAPSRRGCPCHLAIRDLLRCGRAHLSRTAHIPSARARARRVRRLHTEGPPGRDREDRASRAPRRGPTRAPGSRPAAPGQRPYRWPSPGIARSAGRGA